jgi:hypothetical protein
MSTATVVNQPRSQLFTCLACQVVFPTAESQRVHYVTDWHRYNLKRKVAELPPVTSEVYNQKVLGTNTLIYVGVHSDRLKEAN